MSLIDRVKNILLTPKQEWPVIAAESATVGSIFTGYVIPLALIPAVSSFIGFSLIGISFLGGSIKVPMDMGLEYAAITYGLSLVSVYVLALIVDALAPNFGGQKNPVSAFKVAAYSSTAAWVAGIFLLIPSLGILQIAGLYSLVLLFLGLPILMKAPEDKAFAYTAVAAIAGAVLWIVVSQVARRVLGFGNLFV